MSFQVGIGSLGGTVFFQVGLCAPLWTMAGFTNKDDKVQTSKNYETCKDRCKLSHINQTVTLHMRRNLYLKSIEGVAFEQTFTKFIEIFVLREVFLYGKENLTCI